MSERLKKYLGWAGVLAMLLVGYSIYSYANTYERSVSPARSFSVSADAKAVGIPDVAEFSFSVITEGGKDVATLQSANTEKTNKAIEFLKNSGVEEKDIKTESYKVSPRYKNYYVPMSGGSSLPPEIVGYTVTQTVSVKIRDFSKTGDILSGVVNAGANSVSGLNFKIDDDTALKNQARKEAIDKAKVKAKEMARVGGFRVGKLISIDESAPYSYSTKYYGMGGEAVSSTAATAPDIQPGSQEINVNVYLRYEIR